MFADTKVIKNIFYNDTSVQQDFNAYVASKGYPGKMSSESGHDNHFHVRLLDDFKGPEARACSG